MEALAKHIAEVLEEEIGRNEMVGVSYYDRDGVGHVFRSAWAAEKYDPEQVDAIVEELRFESLGHVIHESGQEATLHATVRLYDEMLDIAIPTAENEGIAVALDADGDFSIRDVVATIERAVEEYESGAV